MTKLRQMNPNNADATLERSIVVGPKDVLAATGDPFDFIACLIDDASSIELEAQLVEWLLARTDAGMDDDRKYLAEVADAIRRRIGDAP